MNKKPPRPGRGGGPPSGAAAPGAGQRFPRPPRAASGQRRPGPPPDTVYLWGTHAVVEALRSRRRKPLRIAATEPAAAAVAALAADRGVPLATVPPDVLAARLPPGAVHQGLLLEVRPLQPPALDDVPDEGVVLLLDQVTDPHNVGAILRSAAAFGVTALVMTDRHAPDLGGTLAKAASGGLEHVPVVSVVNLARALDRLGERGFFRVGLDSSGSDNLEAIALPRPLALVLGSESDGLRRLTRERCDAVARLDMPGPIRSLNVSVACAVALTVARLRAPAATGTPP